MRSSKQFPTGKKPTTGTLWYDNKVVMEDRPFPILQAEKKRLLATGYYQKDKFKLTYYYGNKNR